MRKNYAKIDNFNITSVYDETGTFTHFIVVDRNDELAISRKFEKAVDAIEEGHEKFKTIESYTTKKKYSVGGHEKTKNAFNEYFKQGVKNEK